MDSAFGFVLNGDPDPDAPPTLFWYRQSRSYLVPSDAANLFFDDAKVSLADPPFIEEGMVELILEPSARLVEFRAIPSPGEEAQPGGGAYDWSVPFQFSQLNPPDFEEAVPSFIPLMYADKRAAWEGRESSPAARVRVEAASYRGRPVSYQWFRIEEESAAAAGEEPDGWLPARLNFSGAFGEILFTALFLLALPLVRRSLRRQRGDRSGAFRLAGFIFVAEMAIWLLSASHVPQLDAELNLLLMALGSALSDAAQLWVLYIALEPFVRRFWPQSLISWNRLLAGRFRDPLLGRELLVGGAAGIFWVLIERLDSLAPGALGLSQAFPPAALFGPLLLTSRDALALALDLAMQSLYESITFLLLLALLRILFRRAWLAALAFVLVVAPVYVLAGSNRAVSWLTLGAGVAGVTALLLIRFGLVALTTALFIDYLLSFIPITLDRSLWYADFSLFALTVAAGVAAFGTLSALRGPLYAAKNPQGF